jgi:hypothetical protein
VTFDSARRDHQFLRDLSISHATRNQLRHLRLASRQLNWCGLRACGFEAFRLIS